MNAWDNILLGQKVLIIYLSGIFIFVALVALVFIALAIKEKMDEKRIIKKRRAIMSVITDIIKRRKQEQKKRNKMEKKMNKKKIMAGGLVVAALGIAAFLLIRIAPNFTMKDAAIMAAIAGVMAYIALLWILAKKNPQFTGEIFLIGGGIALTIGVLFAPLAAKLFVVILSLPLLLLVLAVILLGVKYKDKISKKGEGKNGENTDEERGIIYQVPNNHRWVLRNVWWSDPNTFDGYKAKLQGYRIKIPIIWHKDEGLVSLVPIQEDPQAFTVNCTDGNPVEVDARVTFYVRDENIDGNHASLYYIVNAKENAHEIVHQRVEVALNRAMDVESDNAISWSRKEKEVFGRDATITINNLLRNDKPEVKEGSKGEQKGKDYGLAAIINVQNVRPTETIQAAKEREKAAEIELKAADPEAKAMQKMIKKTGANPTAVMIAQLLADTFRPIVENKITRKKNTEEKDEK